MARILEKSRYLVLLAVGASLAVAQSPIGTRQPAAQPTSKGIEAMLAKVQQIEQRGKAGR